MCAALCVSGSLSDCESCYLLTLGSVIGAIAFDVFLTVLIAVSVLYYGALLKRRRDAESQNGNGPSKKVAAEDTESPYQELQGVQADVYSELQHFRK